MLCFHEMLYYFVRASRCGRLGIVKHFTVPMPLASYAVRGRLGAWNLTEIADVQVL